MDNWAFFTVDGNEVTRGWQGTEEQARKLARRKANELGKAIEFFPESESATAENDWTAPDGEIVEPG